MKKDKEKKKKRLKRASPSPAPVEVVSAGESVQLAAPEAPLVYFLRVAGAREALAYCAALPHGGADRVTDASKRSSEYGRLQTIFSGGAPPPLRARR